ncbi:MAG: hypothetical protein N2049_01580 [Anaerolineales bacterium]|nr:hypothetical protein [Anaerolineales bacterium]MCX7607898.1 hypothetical protein [Anaerolineales bacterium]
MMIGFVEAQRIWSTVQQPRCSSGFPNGYLLFLSALDEGWQVRRIYLRPSWDQHGFIYLIDLWHSDFRRCQQIVLPKTPQIESLLMPYKTSSEEQWASVCS